MQIKTAIGTLFSTALLLTACGGDSGSSPSTGEMSLDVTDAPSDNLQQAQLTLTAVGLKPKSGPEEKIELEEEIVIENLLDLEGSISMHVMPPTRVKAGEYNWIRLYTEGGETDNFVVTDLGETFPLFVPGQQNGNVKERWVQLVSGFVVPAGGEVDYTLDVDVRRAITNPVGQDYYLLRPAFRIVDNAEVGTISGTVQESLVTDASCNNDLNLDTGNAVYLFAGTNAETGDIFVDESGNPLDDTNPITTANVQQADDGTYTYEIGFVAEGDYTVAFTCQGLSDDPATDDEIVFAGVDGEVSVTAEATTEVNFP